MFSFVLKKTKEELPCWREDLEKPQSSTKSSNGGQQSSGFPLLLLRILLFDEEFLHLSQTIFFLSVARKIWKPSVYTEPVAMQSLKHITKIFPLSQEESMMGREEPWARVPSRSGKAGREKEGKQSKVEKKIWWSRPWRRFNQSGKTDIFKAPRECILQFGSRANKLWS